MSAEKDFISKTASAFSKEEAEEFLGKLKKAGAEQAINTFVKQHGPEIAAAAGGALLTTAAQYMANRPRPGGQPSMQQAISNPAKKVTEEAAARQEAGGGKPSFGTDMSRATARSLSEVSDVLARHPGRGALLAAPAGAAAGLALLRAARRLKGV